MDSGGWQGDEPVVGQVLVSSRSVGTGNAIGKMIEPNNKGKDPIRKLPAQVGVNEHEKVVACVKSILKEAKGGHSSRGHIVSKAIPQSHIEGSKVASIDKVLP